MRKSSFAEKNTTKLTGVYQAIVKDTSDLQRMGRMKAFIPDLGGKVDDPNTWYTIRYLSPFFGATPITELLEDQANPESMRTFDNTQLSYGMWFPLPDIENEIAVSFLNGNPAKGVFIGSLIQQNMNHMVPGLAGGDLFGEQLQYAPVAEYNKLDRALKDQLPNPPRPAHVPLTKGLLEQGLDKDFIRGVTTSSARRENTSRSYGILTPRGHQIVFDDGWNPDTGETDEDFSAKTATGYSNPAHEQGKGSRNDEFIRFRTRSGAQLMINEQYGMIYAISRDGRSWIELSNSGNVDVYAFGKISYHAMDDINFHSGKDINIHAERNINMYAEGKEEGGKISIESTDSLLQTVGGDFLTKVSGLASATVTGNLTLESDNFSSIALSSTYFDSGADTNILSGGQHRETASTIWMNSDNMAVAGLETTEPDPVTKNNLSKTNIKDDDVKSSATSRVPEHEPWAGHDDRNSDVPDIVKAAAEPADLDNFISNKTAQKEAPTVKADEVTSAIEDIDDSAPNISGKQPIENFNISEQGKLAIMNFESFMPYEYYDYKGYSIGYGHLITGGEPEYLQEQFKQGLTEAEAYSLFSSDIVQYERRLKSQGSGAMVTQEQYDALVIFIYNIGSLGSGLRAAVKESDDKQTARKMLEYINVRKNGKLVPSNALLSRRKQEVALFLNSTYPTTSSRSQLEARAVSLVRSRWASQNLELSSQRTTTRQITQAYLSYERMTGNTLPSNNGRGGPSGYSSV